MCKKKKSSTACRSAANGPISWPFKSAALCRWRLELKKKIKSKRFHQIKKRSHEMKEENGEREREREREREKKKSRISLLGNGADLAALGLFFIEFFFSIFPSSIRVMWVSGPRRLWVGHSISFAALRWTSSSLSLSLSLSVSKLEIQVSLRSSAS